MGRCEHSAKHTTNVLQTMSTFATWLKSIAWLLLNASIGSTVSITTDCNSLCDCGDSKFEPVCFTPKNITYYSPCHAGCTSKTVRDSTKERGPITPIDLLLGFASC
ncbi:unnamed protein product [Timema podura]|uniref:Kazal-like domain-containing protein n=1 Tax=Timema podura TaxID=61482 RepID=A0ABN7NXF1_TIMPD|nr:unnamed protein product [Timema podura]